MDWNIQHYWYDALGAYTITTVKTELGQGKNVTKYSVWIFLKAFSLLQYCFPFPSVWENAADCGSILMSYC